MDASWVAIEQKIEVQNEPSLQPEITVTELQKWVESLSGDNAELKKEKEELKKKCEAQEAQLLAV